MKKVLILDGSTAEAFKHFDKKYEFTDLFCLNDEELVKEVHKKYILAGADVVTTNSFNANQIYLEKNISSYDLSKKAAAIAKNVIQELKINKKIYIAGAIGPSNIILSHNEDKNIFTKLKNSYLYQLEAFIESDVDFILLETFFDYKNIELIFEVIDSIKNKINKVIIFSITINKEGKIFSGENFLEIFKKFERDFVKVIGFNCGFGIKGMDKFLEQLKIFNKKIIFYPNVDSKKNYEKNFKEFSFYAENFLKKFDFYIFGSCCSTDFNYTKKIYEIINERK